MSSRPPWLPLGSLLVREGLITTEQLELALLEQQQLRWRLGEILVSFGWVTTDAIAHALAEQYGLEFIDLSETDVDRAAAVLLPASAADEYQALPIRFLDEGVLLVALADPTNVGACDELRDVLGRIQLAVADKAKLERLVESVHGGSKQYAAGD